MKAQHLKCSIAARSLTLAQQMRGSGANRREKQRFLARYLDQSRVIKCRQAFIMTTGP